MSALRPVTSPSADTRHAVQLARNVMSRTDGRSRTSHASKLITKLIASGTASLSHSPTLICRFHFLCAEEAHTGAVSTLLPTVQGLLVFLQCKFSA